MNKNEYYKEKFNQEHLDDLKAESDRREITVYLKVEVTVETHDPDLAIEEALNLLNEGDVYDYCREIKAEDIVY